MDDSTVADSDSRRLPGAAAPASARWAAEADRPGKDLWVGVTGTRTAAFPSSPGKWLERRRAFSTRPTSAPSGRSITGTTNPLFTSRCRTRRSTPTADRRPEGDAGQVTATFRIPVSSGTGVTSRYPDFSVPARSATPRRPNSATVGCRSGRGQWRGAFPIPEDGLEVLWNHAALSRLQRCVAIRDYGQRAVRRHHRLGPRAERQPSSTAKARPEGRRWQRASGLEHELHLPPERDQGQWCRSRKSPPNSGRGAWPELTRHWRARQLPEFGFDQYGLHRRQVKMTIDSDRLFNGTPDATTGSWSASARPTSRPRVHGTMVSMPTCSSPACQPRLRPPYELRRV